MATNMRRVKVAVAGAAGQIGYALLFNIASGQMFGPDVEIELQLIELEHSLPALGGVIMELEDCAFPLLKKVTGTADLKEGMNDINWAILVGAVPRKQGMERSDLLQINGSIFTQQGKAINEKAATDVRVLVVGNPCNTNALIAMHSAKDIPQDRFYAMTMLDETRARAQLAQKAGVAVTEVRKMNIWGNHSATQYPDFYQAEISNKPAIDVIKDEAWLQNNFIQAVQQRGAEIIKARGASSAASAAAAIVRNIYSLTHDTVAGESFSVAKCSTGEYDIDPGLIFSFACRTVQEKLEVVKGIEHNEFSREKIQATLQELRAERDTVRALKLIGNE